MTNRLIGKPPFRFRWVFDFHDKPSRRGVWNYHDPDDLHTNAWLQNLNGLAYAGIEAQDSDKIGIMRFVTCEAKDFCSFAWIGTAKVGGFVKGQHSPQTFITGMTLLARDVKITGYASGEISIEKRTLEDKFLHFGRLENA